MVSRSGTCLLTDPASSTTNGTELEITGCGVYSLREWTLPAGPVLSAVAGNCMDDTGNSATSGTKIQLWTCNGGAAQQRTVPAHDDSLGVELEHGSLCATPASMTAANGAQLVLGACGTDESAWHAL